LCKGTVGYQQAQIKLAGLFVDYAKSKNPNVKAYLFNSFNYTNPYIPLIDANGAVKSDSAATLCFDGPSSIAQLKLVNGC
jgi:hypothetical protein